jgi:hypothetical protein
VATPLLSKDLEVSLRFALVEAKRMRHEYLTLEHLLLAMLQDKRTGEVLSACGANIERMRKKLQKYLEDNVAKFLDGSKAELHQTVGVERVLHRAAIHALATEQKFIDGGDVLVELYREADSYAGHCLEEESIQQLDILKFVAHGTGKEVAGEPAVLALIAKAPSSYRAVSERLHALVLRSAPGLQPSVRSGEPWYAKDGKWVCFFGWGPSFMTFGLSEEAHLARAEGSPHQLLECAWYFTALDEATEAKLSEIVRKAAS